MIQDKMHMFKLSANEIKSWLNIRYRNTVEDWWPGISYSTRQKQVCFMKISK